MTRELIDETDYRATHQASAHLPRIPIHGHYRPLLPYLSQATLRRAHQSSKSIPSSPDDLDRQMRWPQNVKVLQGTNSLEGDDRGGGHLAKTPPKEQRTPPKETEPVQAASSTRRVYRIYKGKRIAL